MGLSFFKLDSIGFFVEISMALINIGLQTPSSFTSPKIQLLYSPASGSPSLCPMSVCMQSHLTVSDSLQPYGQVPARLCCPWDSPGNHTEVGCRALLQGVFPTQGSNPCLLCLPALAGRFSTTSATWEVLVLSTCVLIRLQP